MFTPVLDFGSDFSIKLFNASAVIESRASTRLGENVKLLTFVNIFFLPLSFCTVKRDLTLPQVVLLLMEPKSLWSINNQFSQTSFVITIIIVAISTYLIMFNVNNFVRLCGSVYDARKKNIVRTMKVDTDENWKQRGRMFEVFRPKHEHPAPSRWYIPLYAILRPAALFGFPPGSGDSESSPADGSQQTFLGLNGISNLLRRQRRKPEEPQRSEEGWVL